MTTRNLSPQTEGKLHAAVRQVLQHHGITKVGDGVVEADLIYAVVDQLRQFPEAFRHSYDGYGWLYMDNGSGSSWAEINKPDKEFLYAIR